MPIPFMNKDDTMDLFVVAISYFALTAFFIFIMLFGESPIFKGTPVAGLHWLLTSGLCDCSDWLVVRLCGARGSRAVDAAVTACCDRPNPVLQVSYLVMVAGGYYLYWTNLFSLLPNPWVDEIHILTGTAAVLLSLTLFAAASLSDPGTVHASPPEHLAAWHTLHPTDGAIFPPKTCSTCGLDRPGRSKHCRVCNRCVGRHDHHCAWINNCVGAANTRLFLAFLASSATMTAYGAVLAGFILGGEMERRGALKIRLVNYRTGQVAPLSRLPGKMLEWLVVIYPVGVALGLFMLVASLLLAAFLSYQIYLLIVGRTQYEMYKWRDLYGALQDEAEWEAAEKEAAEQQKGEGEGPQGPRQSGGSGRGWRWGRLWGGGSRQKVPNRPSVVLPPNIYHKGFLANLKEVLLFESYFEAARKEAAAAAAARLKESGGRGKRRERGSAPPSPAGKTEGASRKKNR